jgi:hypothetical protein
MADDFGYPHGDKPAVPSDNDGAERPATPEQWAAMTFAPVLIDPARFGPAWEQARGSIARTAIELLSLDDLALTRHFMEQSNPLMEAMETYGELQSELDYLKTHMEALEMAATRMLCVASRCVENPPF